MGGPNHALDPKPVKAVVGLGDQNGTDTVQTEKEVA